MTIQIKSKSTKVVLGVVVGLILVALLPVHALRQYNTPHSNLKYIRRVFEDNTVGQKINSQQFVSEIRINVRGNDNYPGIIFLSDEQGTKRGEANIDVTPEGQWVSIPLNPPLEPGDRTITLSTTPQTPKEKAILVRFQIQSDIYPAGYMIVNGEKSYGDIAFRAYEKVPFIKSIAIWGQIKKENIGDSLQRIGISALIAVGMYVASKKVGKKTKDNRLTIAALIILALATFAIRVPYLTSIEGIFGGDAFNYLSKAQAVIEGRDPFATDPRKGPFYSFLLIPGFFTEDPLLWSRLVSMFAATGAVIVLAYIGRELKLSWSLSLAAAALLAVNQDFIWESPNALANTLYIFLILASILAYFKAKENKYQWTLAVLLALTFLTRYEGGLLAAILLPALWWREKLPWQKAAKIIGTTAIIMLIPQVSLIWSGVSGIRTVSDIQADGGLYIAGSADALRFNLVELHKFASFTWLNPELESTNALILPALIIGIVCGVGIWYLRRKTTKKNEAYWMPLGIVCLIIAIFIAFATSTESRKYIVAVPWLLTGVGLVPLLTVRSKLDTSALIAVFISQLVFITAILPKERYLMPIVPLLALCIVFGIKYLVSWRKTNIPRLVTLFVAGILIVTIYTYGKPAIADRQEIYNNRAHEVNVMLVTVKYLRGSSHGNIGFRTGAEQTITTYIPENRREIYKAQDTPAAELEWIKSKKIKYLVERVNGGTWHVARLYPEAIERVHLFENIHGEDKVAVYLVDRSKLEK